MTTPATTKRAPRKAPVPPKAPEPQWPAVGADAETLRKMPDVAYLFTELAPATRHPIVITRDMDRELHEASAAADRLPGAHEQMLDEWHAGAHERVHGPLMAFCRPRHARTTDTAGGAAGSAPAPSADQPEPLDAA